MILYLGSLHQLAPTVIQILNLNGMDKRLNNVIFKIFLIYIFCYLHVVSTWMVRKKCQLFNNNRIYFLLKLELQSEGSLQSSACEWRRDVERTAERRFGYASHLCFRISYFRVQMWRAGNYHKQNKTRFINRPVYANGMEGRDCDRGRERSKGKERVVEAPVVINVERNSGRGSSRREESKAELVTVASGRGRGRSTDSGKRQRQRQRTAASRRHWSVLPVFVQPPRLHDAYNSKGTY